MARRRLPDSKIKRSDRYTEVSDDTLQFINIVDFDPEDDDEDIDAEDYHSRYGVGTGRGSLDDEYYDEDEYEEDDVDEDYDDEEDDDVIDEDYDDEEADEDYDDEEDDDVVEDDEEYDENDDDDSSDGYDENDEDDIDEDYEEDDEDEEDDVDRFEHVRRHPSDSVKLGVSREAKKQAETKKKTSKAERSKNASKKETKKASKETVKKNKEQDELAHKRKKGWLIFFVFLFIWSAALVAAIVYGLNYFYNFTIDYEKAYQDSRPVLSMGDILAHFENADIDYIYENMAEKPQVNEFETEADLKEYMGSLLEGKTISFNEASGYSEDTPNYTITADGYAVADIKLRKSSTEEREYHFPVWEMTELNFYTAPTESFSVEAPENYTILVNGIPLSSDYCVQSGIESEENKYVAPYGRIPDLADYYGEGFYKQPTVTAQDASGTEVAAVYDEADGRYEVGFSSDSPEREELEERAIKLAVTFANFISGDTSIDNLSPYFPSGSEDLAMIKRNSSNEFFASHSNVVIQNEEIKDFVCYSEDVCYVEAYIEQSMHVYGAAQNPVILPTDGHFYFVKMDGVWKVAGIKY
ncbi:MAG: hypothetical protein IKO53_01820 [Lachnospiraceae bacterium]|nr:hypothetical protein [Lachnospiraceae bacterium]